MTDQLTIMFIDDDEDDRDLFRDSVKDIDADISCITMDDGKSALEYLAESESLPDYIFLDLSMPGYNGRKFLDKTRHYPKLTEIPVIIYTTSASLEEAEELRAMGAKHFLTKPTDPDEVYYMVSQVINEKWA